MSSRITLPYIYKKYLTKKGKDRILLIRVKSDNPKYHRGRIPRGSKINKDILNSREDAMREKAKIVRYAPIKTMKKDNKLVAGFPWLASILAPMASDLLTGIIRGRGIETKIIKGQIELPVSFLKEMKKVLTLKNLTDLIKPKFEIEAGKKNLPRRVPTIALKEVHEVIKEAIDTPSVNIDARGIKYDFIRGLINNEPLSNKLIINYINTKPNIYKKHFKGIVKNQNLNQMPNLKKVNDFYIIYLENRNYDIGHWCFLLKNKYAFIYFDSEGLNPSNNIINYMLKYDNLFTNRTSKIYLNKTDIQNDLSNLCGYYVLYVVEHLLKHKKEIGDEFEQIMNDFKKDNLENNHLKLLKFFNI